MKYGKNIWRKKLKLLREIRHGVWSGEKIHAKTKAVTYSRSKKDHEVSQMKHRHSLDKLCRRVSVRVVSVSVSVLHYDYDVLYPKINDEGKKIIGYCDSDSCGDNVERRSKMGNMFKIFNSPFSRSSKKQTVVALSTCEVEYISPCNIGVGEQIELLVENKYAINVARDPIAHGRSKQI
ncbi:hypothetical protein MTR_6g035385 [Medicago truncatula]|uniref:Uncharacterized protein n=1 Tax=Medicago truncatula TaxID=3880 RepID=A0A072U899_MEDTR|nr:hypothetical protein MTR_6g035385 [Medicago truncatula]